MKKYLIASAVLAAAVATPAMAATELVTNGNFSQTSRGGNFQFGDDPLSAGTVTGWTSTSTATTRAANNYGYNLLVNGSNTGANADGRFSYTGKEYLSSVPTGTSSMGNFVVLDGDTLARGVLSQTINNLIAGNTYTLTFQWGAGQLASRNGATTESLTYSLGNQSFTTNTVNTTSGGNQGWYTVTQNFVAGGTSQTLSFLSNGTPNGLPPVALLDNVSLTAAVPEPASWALMIVGFGAMGYSLRRRRETALQTA
ncbi:PEPxxWA-CTERM sorting domain-containing protein [Sphingomonas sp.]|uniref:PEPxxWA-CTERM sorting domain-containing protein n=1 Tax=Sphingomonas sp. TaxID=28214 RepID=UPI0025F98D16|nr:PEPxxWA-CTERM sorting domain-containing protein [Sphingomonas sp.]